MISSVISTGLLERHLLPHISLPDLQSLRQLNTAFKQLVASAPDSAWRAAADHTPAHACSSDRLPRGEQIRRSAAARAAIRAGVATTKYSPLTYLRWLSIPLATARKLTDHALWVKGGTGQAVPGHQRQWPSSRHVFRPKHFPLRHHAGRALAKASGSKIQAQLSAVCLVPQPDTAVAGN